MPWRAPRRSGHGRGHPGLGLPSLRRDRSRRDEDIRSSCEASATRGAPAGRKEGVEGLALRGRVAGEASPGWRAALRGGDGSLVDLRRSARRRSCAGRAPEGSGGDVPARVPGRISRSRIGVGEVDRSLGCAELCARGQRGGGSWSSAMAWRGAPVELGCDSCREDDGRIAGSGHGVELQERPAPRPGAGARARSRRRHGS